MRRHKRLRDGFAERLVPPGWPFTPEMQAAGRPGGEPPRPDFAAPPAVPSESPGLNPPARQEQAGPVKSCDLWIQAASGGEAYLAGEILKRLAASGRRLSVLCTTCTAQGLEVLHKTQLELRDAPIKCTVNFLPLDEPALMRRAVAQVFGSSPAEFTSDIQRDFQATERRARVLVLLETEIWPGLLSACTRAGVRVVILNGRMTQGSFKGYRLLAPFLRRLAPFGIMATDKADLERFCRVFDSQSDDSEKSAVKADFANGFGEDEGSVAGVPPYRGLMRNIKFDRLAFAQTRPDSPEPPVAAGLSPLVLASVRQEEEEELLRTMAVIFKLRPDVSIAVAPRHMHRAAAWADLLSGSGQAFERRSALAEGVDPARLFKPGTVALWDVFGEMDYLYRRAGAVFVGGSLAPLGGQNFLEPLAYGLTPCIGPFWSNFYWAGHDLFDLGLVRQIQRTEELPGLLLDLAQNPRPRPEVISGFNRYLEVRRGGAAQAVRLIFKALEDGF